MDISNHVVVHFNNLFNSTSYFVCVDRITEVVSNLIISNINSMLTNLPSMEEIHHVVFALNPNNALRSDGFRDLFFQKNWEIIKYEVVKVILEFFTSNWLFLNFNSNSMVPIPKNDNAESIDHYRPITMTNFKFKVISNILANRLPTSMPSIIPKEKNDSYMEDL